MFYQNNFLLKSFSKLLFGFVVLVGIVPASAQNSGELGVLLKTTFKKNPNVLISEIGMDFQEGQVQVASGEFNPVLDFGINKSYNISPSTIDQRNGWLGYAESPSFETDILEYELAVSKRFQIGTLVRTSVGVMNFGRDALFEGLSNAGFGDYVTNRGRVFVDVTQPLLQGRGKKFYGATIDIENLRLSQSQLNYTFAINSQAYIVILNYLNVISARKELEIQESIEKNYEEFEDQIRQLSDKDIIPKAELTFINANLSSQNATVLSSKSYYLTAQNQLLEAMGVSAEELKNYDFDSIEFAIDSLANEIEDGYLSFWLNKASTTRRDYLAAQKNITINDREIEYANQRNKAKLDVSLGMGYNGIYESTSFEQYVAPLYSNYPGMSYRAGLVFQWPMGMNSTKGAYAAALAKKRMSQEAVRNLELNIQQQLSSYFNDIVYFNEAVKQGQKSVEFNLQARKNEYLKLQLGTSTVVNLVQVQNNYAFAQTSLNRLKLALNSAIIRFRFESGNLMKITELEEIVVDVDELFSLPKITAQNEK